MTKNEIKKFEETLIELNAYKAFLINFANSYGNYCTLNEVYRKPKDVALYSAFNWKESPEGTNYWFDIDDKIMEKLSN